MATALCLPVVQAQGADHTRSTPVAMLLDIDWNQLYYTLLSYGFSPADANQLIMQAQKDAGDPVVGCTSSPENPTALLAALGSAGLLVSFWRRRNRAGALAAVSEKTA